MEKYSIETLMPLNSVYHATHRVLENDVAMVNMYRDIIEASPLLFSFICKHPFSFDLVITDLEI